MPRRDGTGPNGMGAMTGRRTGFYNSGFNDCSLGRCFGGNGFQRGYRGKSVLEMQETQLENQLNEFIDIYNKSDIIISKGQGNYEALSEEKENNFFS